MVVCRFYKSTHSTYKYESFIITCFIVNNTQSIINARSDTCHNIFTVYVKQAISYCFNCICWNHFNPKIIRILNINGHICVRWCTFLHQSHSYFRFFYTSYSITFIIYSPIIKFNWINTVSQRTNSIICYWSYSRIITWIISIQQSSRCIYGFYYQCTAVYIICGNIGKIEWFHIRFCLTWINRITVCTKFRH